MSEQEMKNWESWRDMSEEESNKLFNEFFELEEEESEEWKNFTDFVRASAARGNQEYGLCLYLVDECAEQYNMDAAKMVKFVNRVFGH